MNKVVHGHCIDISFEGKGVCKTEEGIVFVENCFIGEEVELEIEYKRAGNFFGKIKRIIDKSPFRIQPRCKICSSCGGCQFQQLFYAEQLRYKTKIVRNAFKRHFDQEFDVLDCLGMENPFFYRNKVQIPLGYNKKHNVICGFYRENSHEIIENTDCCINDKRVQKILKSCIQIMNNLGIIPFDEKLNMGDIKHLLIKTSLHYENIMLVIVTKEENFAKKHDFLREIVKFNPEITTIVQNINSKNTNVILGTKEIILFGDGKIKDSILGVDFVISSKSFFQVNPYQVETLYSKAIEAAKITKNDTVVDFYCGIGTISLILSQYCKQVYGVEIVKEAIEDANKNKRLNNINNVEFVCDDSSNFVKDITSKIKNIDTVVVDPPRKGLDYSFIDTILEMKPHRIVYISCNCETLARDMEILSKEYEIDSIQPVDMFPMTHHIETVCALSLKSWQS